MPNNYNIILINPEDLNRNICPAFSDRDATDLGIWPSKFPLVELLPSGVELEFVMSVWGRNGYLRYLFVDADRNLYRRHAWQKHDYVLPELADVFATFGANVDV